MRKLSARLAVSLAALLIPFSAAVPITPAAAAASYDETRVMSDLAEIDLEKYPKASGKDPVLVEDMGLVEYAFTLDETAADVYGIYLYVYNPACNDYDLSAGTSRANVAVSYDAEGKPATYEMRELVFLDQSSDRRFLKFKLENSEEFYRTEVNYSAAHDGARRYDVAALDLTLRGDRTPTAYDIKWSFTCTGYCAGCYPNNTAKSTLKIAAEGLDIIEITAHAAQYHTGSYTGEPDELTHDLSQNLLSSVYFSIPKKYITDYGPLTYINFEYYEYRTTPIIVCDDESEYQMLRNVLGYTLPECYDDANLYYFDGAIDWFFRSNEFLHETHWVYNEEYGTNYKRKIDRLDWLFWKESLQETVSSKEIEAYATQYKGAKGDGQITIGAKTFNEHLFDTSVEPGHTLGYNERTVDLRNEDDYIDLKLENTTSWWGNFCQFIDPKTDYQTYITANEIAPFVPVNDVPANDDIASGQLYIDKTDVGDFRTFCEAELKAGNQPYLLRFSLAQYITEELSYSWHSDLIDPPGFDYYGVIAPVFLNFRVVYLGFLKDTVETVIPVVQTPIDIFPDITPPPELVLDSQWWYWCAIAGGAIAVLAVATFFFEKHNMGGK